MYCRQNVVFTSSMQFMGRKLQRSRKVAWHISDQKGKSV